MASTWFGIEESLSALDESLQNLSDERLVELHYAQEPEPEHFNGEFEGQTRNPERQHI